MEDKQEEQDKTDSATTDRKSKRIKKRAAQCPCCAIASDKEHKITCPDSVIEGSLITKEKRITLFGSVSGGSGARRPEEFQRAKIIEGTGINCGKTNVRINLRTGQLNELTHPNICENGFDFSEDFDGVQMISGKLIYVNLKCVVGKGGAQTRSLREVYWFIEGQLKTLLKKSDIYFANILDGDEPHSQISKFMYLLSLPEFADVGKHVYVGDLKGYFAWICKIIA